MNADSSIWPESVQLWSRLRLIMIGSRNWKDTFIFAVNAKSNHKIVRKIFRTKDC